MGSTLIIMTVCYMAQPDRCEEQRLAFAWRGSPRQCVMSAQSLIARGIGEHPQWTVRRYRCENPDAEQKAESGGQRGTSFGNARRPQWSFSA
jgi:hypothetical protein